jgi:S1-C subfamily serine protease
MKDKGMINMLIAGVVILLVISVVSEVQLFNVSKQLKETKEQTAQQIDTLNKQVSGLGEDLTTTIANVDVLEENDKALSSALTTQGDYLNQKIGFVQNQSNTQLKTVQAQLSDVEKKNKKLISDLEDELGEKIQDLNLQSSDFTAIVNDVIKSVVSVLTDTSQGSGVFISSTQIITNNHVIKNAGTIQILTHDGKLHAATVVGTNANEDLALLRISSSYKALPLTNSDNVQIGEKVIALGNPGGLGFTVTEGIVSQKRDIGGLNFIQTDVPINPGNSGGPLVNKQGQVIGINTLKISGFEGIGFSITSNRVTNFINGLS